MQTTLRVKAVLFDLDGTLVDSAPDLGAAADQMRVARGMASLPLAAYRHMAGSGARGMLNVAFGITPEHPDFLALRDEFFVNYEARMTLSTRPFPQVHDLVAGLQRLGLPWGVVTNKAERFALPLTASIDLFRDASTVVGGDTTPHPKPHPAPLWEAARRMGVAPTDCVYVGDDERDIQAGKAAGMRTVAAAYGYLGLRNDIAQWGADAHVDTPEALLHWLTLA